MIDKTLPALGGLGLFLLGMGLLTQGLRSLAGSSLRRVLTRFTKSPISGAVTGAIATAILQSSSATTVAAVGFVGAGLLTFSQSLGIIFGANIGTTMTGWIVALIGFELDLGKAVLPLVFLGALMRLLGKGRAQQVGLSLAGFALLFIGIATLQTGMAAFGALIRPEDLPPDTLLGRLALVGIGMIVTIVTQSSSAGVATAMVALGAGVISFSQAAAMVIGMDVGTTFTAALATLGGSTNMRRTGIAHVVYNVMTGLLAFFLLPFYLVVVQGWLGSLPSGQSQSVLVAFHTSFNIIGVVLILPFTRPFARLIERLVPARGPMLTEGLDESFFAEPSSAIDAARGVTAKITQQLANTLTQQLHEKAGSMHFDVDIAACEEALVQTRDYVDRIALDVHDADVRPLQVALLNVFDHLERLNDRCRQFRRIDALDKDLALAGYTKDLVTALRALAADATNPALADSLDTLRQKLRRARRTYRDETFARLSDGRTNREDAGAQLDAVRWLHRTCYHLWRIAVHLGPGEPETAVNAQKLPEV